MPLPIFKKEKKKTQCLSRRPNDQKRKRILFATPKRILFGTHPNHDALTKFHQRRLVTRDRE
jgi:hypothetical protein